MVQNTWQAPKLLVYVMTPLPWCVELRHQRVILKHHFLTRFIDFFFSLFSLFLFLRRRLITPVTPFAVKPSLSSFFSDSNHESWIVSLNPPLCLDLSNFTAFSTPASPLFVFYFFSHAWIVFLESYFLI
jgi:hypothetical protein